MKKILHILTLAAVLMAVSVNAFSQTQPTFTTLSAAISDERTTRFTVASATGFVASNQTTGLNYGAFIDNEFIRITAVSGTTITGTRGQANTNATSHKSGARVFVGQYGSQQQSATQTGGPFIQGPLKGSCTRTAYPYLPLIQVNANALDGQGMYDCLGGQWLAGTLLDQPGSTPLVAACTVPIGSVAYGSFGTSTTASTTGEFTASVWVPTSFVATGITNLHGSAVDGAAKAISILRDSTGNRLAWSALAGTVTATNDAFQAIPFTATRIVVGPALYAIGIQNDTADVNAIRTVAASTFNNLVASSITSVFGTVAATVTLPTTFTADTGPVACIYR